MVFTSILIEKLKRTLAIVHMAMIAQVIFHRYEISLRIVACVSREYIKKMFIKSLNLLKL